MNSPRSSGLAWWSAATILVSAFLLFQVQPVISKKILPWFGGSPAVWTTCVLFFQLVLLGGYAYSHWLIRYVSPKKQGLIHVTLLLLAVGTLLIGPRDFWKPADGNIPALRILVLLLAVVGASYFLLSTTGPLVQAWYSQLYPGHSPYRLYALSNVGSLAALLTYPFLIETTLTVNWQWAIWALGFVVFAGLIGIMALTMWRESNAVPLSFATVTPPASEQPVAPAAEGLVVKKPTANETKPAEAPAKPAAPPSAWLKAGWLCLAALGSMALLAVTNHLCQDIAVVPFMWVIPLSLYLITFIICFDNERWYVRKIFGTAAVLGVLWLTAMQHYGEVDKWVIKIQKPITSIQQRFAERSARAKLKAEGKEVEDSPAAADVDPIDFSDSMDKLLDGIDWTVRKAGALMGRLTGKKYDWKFNVDTYDFFDSVVAASTAYLLIMFLICMVCHGELVKSKPAPEHLTSFFLFISAGGAVGGLFVALVCPLVFKHHFELALVMMGGFLVGCVALANDGRETWLKGREVLQWIGAFILIGGLFLVAKGNIEDPEKNVIAEVRNFYGTVRVEEKGEDEYRGRYLYNGRIWHGFQYLDPARQIEATTYYVNGTGAALAVQQHPRASGGLRIAVIGLGTGSMAAHCKAGDMIRFYDIDPKVVDVARKYFTYLDKNHAGKENTEVILGDARISMERELKEKGSQEFDVIVLDAFSSDAIPAHLLTVESFDLYDKHLRKENGKTTGVMAIHISNRYLDLEPVVLAIAEKFGYQTWNVHKDEDDGPIDTGSDWVLASKNEAFMNDPIVKEAGVALDPNKKLLWTDQFTALYPILK